MIIKTKRPRPDGMNGFILLDNLSLWEFDRIYEEIMATKFFLRDLVDEN